MTNAELNSKEMVLRVMRVAELLLASSTVPSLDKNENSETKTQDSERDVKCDEIQNRQQ